MMMNARAIATLALIVGLSGQAQGTSLQGTVRDADTNQPISGVFLTLQISDPDSIQVPMVSAADGTYGASGFASGDAMYVLMVAGLGYTPVYARLDALGQTDMTYDVYLHKEAPPVPGPTPPDSSLFSGSVLAPAGAAGSLAPVAGALVTLSSGGTHVDLRTGFDGRYAAKLPFGTYALGIDATGYKPFLSQVTLDARGIVVDSALEPNPTPTHQKTWGSVKASYR